MSRPAQALRAWVRSRGKKGGGGGGGGRKPDHDHHARAHAPPEPLEANVFDGMDLSRGCFCAFVPRELVDNAADPGNITLECASPFPTQLLNTPVHLVTQWLESDTQDPGMPNLLRKDTHSLAHRLVRVGADSGAGLPPSLCLLASITVTSWRQLDELAPQGPGHGKARPRFEWRLSVVQRHAHPWPLPFLRPLVAHSPVFRMVSVVGCTQIFINDVSAQYGRETVHRLRVLGLHVVPMDYRYRMDEAELDQLLPQEYKDCLDRNGESWAKCSGLDNGALVEHYLGLIDAIVVPGSVKNVHPKFYGAEGKAKDAWLDPDPRRNDFELLLLRKALLRGMPTLAICNGACALNVAGGGSLQFADKTKHVDWAGRRGFKHAIDVRTASMVGTTMAPKRGVRRFSLAVNSCHYQVPDALGPMFETVGVASDGACEVFELRHGAFVVGLLFHPELLDEVVCRGRWKLDKGTHNGAKAFARHMAMLGAFCDACSQFHKKQEVLAEVAKRATAPERRAD